MNPNNSIPTPPITPIQPLPPTPPMPVTTPPKKVRIGLIIGVIVGGLILSAGIVTALLIINAPHDEVVQTTAPTKTTMTSKESPFSNMDKVSTGTETATTNCYSFTVPKGYTSSSNNNACTVTMTSTADSKTVIKTDVLLSEYCNEMDDLVSCINGRYEEIAKEANRTFYGASKVSINAYPTGLAYLDSTDARKRAHYTIENVGHASKATSVTSISAFSVVGFADTDTYDADTRLVAQSFVITK